MALEPRGKGSRQIKRSVNVKWRQRRRASGSAACVALERNKAAKPPKKGVAILNPNQNIVVLTGAGISKESGLDTFRDEDGIWSKVRIEDVATPEAFARDPGRVHDFYNMRRNALGMSGVKPNAGHKALARLEAEWPGRVLVVTQNVDNLHEAAGGANVLHMHGELMKARCAHCGDVFAWADDLDVSMECQTCARTGGLRPHVVWFGEMPIYMEEIHQALELCGLFVSIGTSGNVYPAAGFVQHVRMTTDAHTVELNLEPSEGSAQFAETIYGQASEIVPAFVQRVLEKGW